MQNKSRTTGCARLWPSNSPIQSQQTRQKQACSPQQRCFAGSHCCTQSQRKSVEGNCNWRGCKNMFCGGISHHIYWGKICKHKNFSSPSFFIRNPNPCTPDTKQRHQKMASTGRKVNTTRHTTWYNINTTQHHSPIFSPSIPLQSTNQKRGAVHDKQAFLRVTHSLTHSPTRTISSWWLEMWNEDWECSHIRGLSIAAPTCQSVASPFLPQGKKGHLPPSQSPTTWNGPLWDRSQHNQPSKWVSHKQPKGMQGTEEERW